MILGESQGVAILSASNKPMSWRTFELAPGHEGEIVLSAAMALMIVGRFQEEIPVAGCFGEMIAQIAAVTLITLYLHWRCQSVNQEYATIRAQTAKHAWLAKGEDRKIETEKKDLGLKIDAVKEFLETRILWSAYTRDPSSSLPESILLRALMGVCDREMGARRVGKPKKQLVLKLTAPIASGRIMPKEIDGYLDELRLDLLMLRDFPVIENADLRSTQASWGNASAEFTVNCLPKTVGGPRKEAALGV